jgi:hypothetical protein
MPCRGSKAKEAGSLVIGGETIGIFCAGIDEATHYGRNNEDILEAVHSTTRDHFPLG